MRPSVLAGSFFALHQLFPRYRPRLWGFWYNRLATHDTAGNFLFMNYGYVPQDGRPPLVLAREDEPNRYCIQLYDTVLAGVKVASSDVLEVGCGRGGGGSFCIRYMSPHSYTGVDLSETAIQLCKRSHKFPNATWIQGRADALPVPNASVDVVLNVESSHSYPSASDFFKEVARVLRPGGTFAWCDVNKQETLNKLRTQMIDAGLQEVESTIITTEVLRALDSVTATREEQIAKYIPRFLRPAFRDFAGVKGSTLYNLMRTGGLVYQKRLLRKP